MKPMKFRISSPEQSERLQKVLFKLNIGWCGDPSTGVEKTDAMFLFVDSKFIAYEMNDIDYFDSHDNKEKNTEKFIAKHSGEKKVKKSKWQSVEEELPEKVNKHYLVWCESVQCVFTAYIDSVDKRWKCAYSHEYLTFVVSSWREIPKGPNV